MPSDTTSYDRVPYSSLAFPQTHPDRLATMARIFGVSTPDVGACRVLELGCASGGNLIPMAFNLPRSEFVGVDLSRHQVDDGRSVIRDLGLSNIRIEHASILDIGPDFGTFDYSICHGVFSWVDEPVQEKILQVASDNLSATGVAYISYNTYPGWHMREGVRRMMRYHTRQFDEPQEQIDQARVLLDFLAASSDAQSAYSQQLRDEVALLRGTADSYLFHEHLEVTNAPIYFYEFMDLAGAAGLQYLCESDLATVMSHRFPAPVAQTLERISPDIVQLEQYMDFVRNRRFRQTLLCHRSVTLNRALSPSVLHGVMASCRVSSDQQPIDFTPGTTTVFRVGERRIETTQSVIKAAFAVLNERFPHAVDVDELCRVAIDRATSVGERSAPPDSMRKAVMEQLFQCVVAGVIELHTCQAACASVPTELPRANRLAAYQAETQEVVVNAWHETVKLDELSRVVMRLADGHSTRRDIVDSLVTRVADGAIRVHANDQTVRDIDAARPLLTRGVDEALASLARAALLAD